MASNRAFKGRDARREQGLLLLVVLDDEPGAARDVVAAQRRCRAVRGERRCAIADGIALARRAGVGPGRAPRCRFVSPAAGARFGERDILERHRRRPGATGRSRSVPGSCFDGRDAESLGGGRDFAGAAGEDQSAGHAAAGSPKSRRRA